MTDRSSTHGSEFEEIGHSGGKIEFIKEEGGHSLRVSNSNPLPWAVFFLAVSYDGTPLHFIPMRGVGAPFRQISPSLLVPITSDREGMFGRQCPACHTYFRSRHVGPVEFCPYCELQADNVQFTTRNQHQFIQAYCRAAQEALRSDESVTIDLDALADALPENRAGWIYTEERQQRRVTCGGCKNEFDIMGEFGACPKCGARNNGAVLDSTLDSLMARFEVAKVELTDRQERGNEWQRLLVAAVSAFEGAANDLRAALLRLPHTPRRRAELSSLSLQNITQAGERLAAWFGFDILDGLDETEKQFLKRMVHRRHLLTHRAGVVDEEYLAYTGDTSVRKGQRIRVDSREVPRAIDLLRRVGANFCAGHASIGWPQAADASGGASQ